MMHADPAAELPAVALALDAKFRVARQGADREIPASDFFLDYLTTAVDPDEMLREIVFPFVRPAAGFALEEITRLKPSAAKGRYIKKAAISTTIGPGIPIDPNRTRNLLVEEDPAAV